MDRQAQMAIVHVVPRPGSHPDARFRIIGDSTPAGPP
jgi:hypothetical protein